MEQKKNRTRSSAKMSLGGILLRAALILLCLILLSIHLMGSLYAKYSSTATGSDSARVAKFDVDVAYNEETGKLTISNLSEVTVAYRLSFELSLVDPDENGNYDVPEGDVTITFEDDQGNSLMSGMLQYNSEVSGFLVIQEKAHDALKISIIVNATQVD